MNLLLSRVYLHHIPHSGLYSTITPQPN